MKENDVPIEVKKKLFDKYLSQFLIRETPTHYILKSFYAEKDKIDKYGKLYISKDNMLFYNFRVPEMYVPLFKNVDSMRSGSFKKLLYIYAKYFNDITPILEYNKILGVENENLEGTFKNYKFISRSGQEIKNKFFMRHFPLYFQFDDKEKEIFDKYWRNIYSIYDIWKVENGTENFINFGMGVKLYSIGDDGKFYINGIQARLFNENNDFRFLTVKRDEKPVFFLHKGVKHYRTMIVSEGVKELLWVMFLFKSVFSLYFSPLRNDVNKDILTDIVRRFEIKQIFVLKDNDIAGQKLLRAINDIFKKSDVIVFEICYDNSYKDFSDFVNIKGQKGDIVIKTV